ncbi:acetyl-CoA carboxylase carboxyltransferase subunit alpha [Actinoallomurus sp. NPDC052274]|uniref:acetyl-CoA carboxylase carboxyltransferase subunit alpha n=1 Tax=Actinoallomurus sp. NPDC052274 TaxID=3155420 RepID=UPI00341C1815
MTALSVASGPAQWVRCPRCQDLIYGRRYERDLRVCHGCGAHARLTAPERIAQLLDPDTAVPIEPAAVVEDPLGFTDSVPYPDRLRDARERTGLTEAVTCVMGTLMGHPLVAAVMDFRFLGGSLGVAVGEAIALAAATASRRRAPLLIVTASGGARMQEGAYALMQMAKTSQALVELDEAGILTISLISDPTYGGVAASYATLSDVIIAEPDARIGFAGPRVIQQTIREELPEGFQTAEFMRERGMIDRVVPRSQLRPVIASLLGVQRTAGPEPAAPGEAGRGAPGEADDHRPRAADGGVTRGAYDGALRGADDHRRPHADEEMPGDAGDDGQAGLIRDPDRVAVGDPWQAVGLARHQERPTTLDYVYHLLADFQELRGDRLVGDCPAIVGGVGRLGDEPVVLIGHEKGHGTAERIARNFGMAMPEGYRKAARLMRLAAKLGLPVITLVDTPGAHPGTEAEERGQAWAIAENIRLMSGLPVPIVSVVTGEGGSGGALALAVGDRVLACAGAIYSVISPEGCAAILWKDQAAAPEAAAALRIDARELLRHRIVDAVVPEPEGGAHRDPAAAGGLLRAALLAALREVRATDPADLVRLRRLRFRRYGLDDGRTGVDSPASDPRGGEGR